MSDLKKKKKKRSKTSIKNECDRLFSRLIRSAGYCYRCSSTHQLQCAHIVSRSYLSVRWNRKNALCLCSSCHVFFTYHPLEWSFFIDYEFPGRFAELRELALSYQKVDLAAVLAELKADVARMI